MNGFTYSVTLISLAALTSRGVQTFRASALGAISKSTAMIVIPLNLISEFLQLYKIETFPVKSKSAYRETAQIQTITIMLSMNGTAPKVRFLQAP
jgi:hypothetical protein